MSEETIETTADALEASIDEATDAIRVQTQELEEQDGVSAGAPLGLENLLEVPVRVTVRIGQTQLTLARLVELGPGSLVRLDREAHEPADVLVNGRVVARGEVVTMDDVYGVRITQVVKDA